MTTRFKLGLLERRTASLPSMAEASTVDHSRRGRRGLVAANRLRRGGKRRPPGVRSTANSRRIRAPDRGVEHGVSSAMSTPARPRNRPRRWTLGNAVAVWHRSTGRDSVVQAAIRPAGGTRSAPQTVCTRRRRLQRGRRARGRPCRAVWIMVRSGARSYSPPPGRLRRLGAAGDAVRAGGNSHAGVAMGRFGAPLHPGSGPTAATSSCRPRCGRALGWSVPRPFRPPCLSSGRRDGCGRRRSGRMGSPQRLVARRPGRSAKCRSELEPPQNLSARGGNAGGLDLAMNRAGRRRYLGQSRPRRIGPMVVVPFRRSGKVGSDSCPGVARAEARVALTK